MSSRVSDKVLKKELNSFNPHKLRIPRLMSEKLMFTNKPEMSVDVKVAIDSFESFRPKVHALAEALRKHYDAMMLTKEGRMKVANKVADLSNNTPLQELLGYPEILSKESNEPKTGSSNNKLKGSTSTSYFMAHQKLSREQDRFHDRFEEYIVTYCEEWERVITHRFNKDRATVENHKRDLDHYTQKVSMLKKSLEKVKLMGKAISGQRAEKLYRNEQKLEKALNDYNNSASSLVKLIAELVDKSWKDLLPLTIKLLQYDEMSSNTAAAYFSAFNENVVSLYAIASASEHQPLLDRLQAISSGTINQIRHGTSVTDFSARLLKVDDDDYDNDEFVRDEDSRNSSQFYETNDAEDQRKLREKCDETVETADDDNQQQDPKHIEEGVKIAKNNPHDNNRVITEESN